jgi:acyl-CoA thioester hydrolase
MNKIFQYPVTIIERHLDFYGHVNNAVYLELYEEARWDFITKGGYGHDRIQKDKCGPVLIELNLTFKRELKNREKIMIESTSLEMKNKFVMQLEQKMIKDDGKVASVLLVNVGLFDMTERKLVLPNADWLQAIGIYP